MKVGLFVNRRAQAGLPVLLRGAWRCGGGGFGAVDEILEFFAGLEEGDFLWRDFDFFAGFGIAAYATATLARAEAAEAADFDLVALLNGLDDAVEDGLD